MLNQGYVPCDKQIHIKLSEAELQMIWDRMAQMGFKNLSAYVRKMAIDGYYIKVDFKELLEVIRLLRIDSNNINQIAKAANTYGGVDGKIISDMKAEHEKVLKKVEKCFDKYLEIKDWVLSLFCRRSLSMKIDNQGDWDALPNKQNRIGCIPMHCLPICERPILL